MNEFAKNPVPIAVIGGSGAYHLLAGQSLGQEKNCKSLNTPYGESAPIHHFSFEGLDFLFLSRHGETDYSLTAPFVNYRANIHALKECGVQRVIAWSGPGIINTAFKPGEFVVPHDIIDETRNRPSTFFEGTGIGFIRQNNPFCPQITNALHDVLHNAALPHHEEAVYACTEGPRLETPAEIRKLRILGADLVGMTLVPEAVLAREKEICYTPFCYLTNYAEGVKPQKFKKGEQDIYNVQRSRRWVEETDFTATEKGWIKKQRVFSEKPAGTSGYYFNMIKRYLFNLMQSYSFY